MPEQFLQLPPHEQADILNAAAQTLKKAPAVLEKDIWVCRALELLFSMPGGLPMAFKGGTALSKVYNVIDRFSEDIDITIDYRGFVDEIKDAPSKSAIKRISDQLKEFVANYSKTVVKPYFENAILEQFSGKISSVDVSEDGERLRIHYSSVFEEQSGRYLASDALIEFGGRNVTEPNQTYVVRPYVADALPELKFPEAKVTVLSLARSFWEKATLIHVECNRMAIRPGAERLSRHWYDIWCLYKSGKANDAIQDRALLEDVVRHKKFFFNASYAKYDDCLAASLKLLPDAYLIKALEKDFNQMIEAGMFYSSPVFAEIVKDIGELQEAINDRR